MRPYRGAEVKVEAEEATQGDADDVVASHVDIGNKRLPTAAHGHPCICISTSVL